MNYNDWAKEIHENAVKHGWYDKPISQYEYAALFHSKTWPYRHGGKRC